VEEALRAVDGIELVEPSDDDGVVEALGDAPVLVTFVWDDRFLTPALRWIQSVSAGVEQYPIEALRERGVALTSARGVNAPQVAEHVFALLLALTRAVGISMREAEKRVWRPRMGEELEGRVMAVLGLGTIGEEVARRAQLWGMEVVGTKAHPKGYRGHAVRVLPPEETVEACRLADVVVAVLPGGDSTRHLVGREAFDALGRGWFVNVGRGSTVDTSALLEALDHGELRGAGLDVFEDEPLPADSPLWSHPRVVLTPHIAGLSPLYGPRLARIFTANLEAFRRGRGWTNRVV
jgi:phosphoglycerate dehydrogenase-like enzyme